MGALQLRVCEAVVGGWLEDKSGPEGMWERRSYCSLDMMRIGQSPMEVASHM